MATLIVRPASGPLRGSVPVPSDKSIAHRAIIFAALSNGRCELRQFSYGKDNVATLDAFRAMGIAVEDDQDGTLHITGSGLRGLKQPTDVIDCGNSGTSMRLLAGVLAAQPWESELVGDASLSGRPMGRITQPLTARGAVISGTPHGSREGEVTAPLNIGPLPEGTLLKPFEFASPIASAQVKSALLLSGLYASGPTLLTEPVVSRDHTERMMAALRLPISSAGTALALHPPADPNCIDPFEIDLPGDLSAAAFILAAGLIVPNSCVVTRSTGTNPTRAGFVQIARALGGTLEMKPQGDSLGEELGEMTAFASPLRGAEIGGETATRAIDEVPICCALAARASGTTEFHDVGELRVKESDRIRVMLDVLRAFGLRADELDTGLRVHGQPEGALKSAKVTSHGDHRIAMTAAVLGLVAEGETVVEDVDCIGTSFPRFAGTLRALGADIEVKP